MSRALYPEIDDAPVVVDQDGFRKIWARQLRFNSRVHADRGVSLSRLSSRELAAFAKDYVLHVEGELHELLRETDWKMHARVDRPLERGNALEEFVDSLKFLIGLGQVFGFDPDEVIQEFDRKSTVVEYRYAMERRLRSIDSSRVIAVDLDGVLNDYPACFVKWVYDEGMIDSPIPVTYSELVASTPPRKFAQLKDEYRRSGAKASQGVAPGAFEGLRRLRDAGFRIVVISSRPYQRFSRIFADTLFWADHHGLEFDAILFHKEKHLKILEDFPSLVAMVEDDPVIAAEVVRTGHRVFYVRNELNRGIEVPGSESVDSFNEFVKRMLTSSS